MASTVTTPEPGAPSDQEGRLHAPGPVVDARDLRFGFSSSHQVLRGVTLQIQAGQLTMVLGASGSGKTTLLKLIKGLLRAQAGDLRVLGRPNNGNRRDVAYIPQNLGLVRNLSVIENVLTGALTRVPQLPALFHVFPKTEVEEALAVLGRLQIGHKAYEKVHSLSGGERQRVAIARAAMQRAPIMLADEFVSQLDPVTTHEIMDVVKSRAAMRGVTIIQTTHELEIVAKYGDYVIVLRDGAVAVAGAPREIDLAGLSQVIKS